MSRLEVPPCTSASGSSPVPGVAGTTLQWASSSHSWRQCLYPQLFPGFLPPAASRLLKLFIWKFFINIEKLKVIRKPCVLYPYLCRQLTCCSVCIYFFLSTYTLLRTELCPLKFTCWGLHLYWCHWRWGLWEVMRVSRGLRVWPPWWISALVTDTRGLLVLPLQHVRTQAVFIRGQLSPGIIKQHFDLGLLASRNVR